MRRQVTLLILLAVSAALTGCKSDILMVASYNQEDARTRIAVNVFDETFQRSALGKPRLEVHPMDFRSVKTKKGRDALAGIARLKALKSSAKVVVFEGEPAIREVAQKIKGAKIQMVVSGLRAHPAEYGLTRGRNVFGVWAPPDLAGAMELLKKVAPKTKTAAILTDRGPSAWIALTELRARKEWPLEVVSVQQVDTRDAWLAAVSALQNKADAILALSMDDLKDSMGNLASAADVAKVTGLASRVPTVGFSRDTVMQNGLLLAHTPSALEVARLAAAQTLRVLRCRPEVVEPRFVKATQSSVYVNVLLADRLGVKIPKDVIRNAAGVVRRK